MWCAVTGPETDLSHYLTAAVSRAIDNYLRGIDAHLHALPAGSRLCVHTRQWDADTDPLTDLYTVRMGGQTHVLAPGRDCDATVQRVVYGPKTAP